MYCMRKNYLLPAFCIMQLIFVNIVSAQESNLNEDYSVYLPEIRAVNKQLSQIPQTGSVLTKEGLAEQRNGWRHGREKSPPNTGRVTKSHIIIGPCNKTLICVAN